MINETLKKDFYDSIMSEFKSVNYNMKELPEDKTNPFDFYDIRDLFLIYVNWRKRFISRGSRKVFYSKELKEKLSKNKKLKKVVEKLEYKFKNKEDITPFLTKQIVHNPHVSKKGMNIGNDKDLLLNFFGIQHFHLESTYSKKKLKGINFTANNSNKRGADLLYAKVDKDIVYFIDINEHKLFDEEVLKIMKNNWEYLLKEYETTMVDVSEYTKEENIELLKIAINTPYIIDDKTYMFSTISMEGTSSDEFFKAKAFFQNIQKQYNELMIKKKNEIDLHIIIKNGLLFFIDNKSKSTIKFEEKNLYFSKNSCEIGYHTYDFNS